MSELAVIVPTRSRPQNIASVVDAWTRTDAWRTADLWWVLDADDARLSEYTEQLDPHSGKVRLHIVPTWKPLVPKLNDTATGLRVHFGYRYLAFMGDDHIPRTAGWAESLIADHRGAMGGSERLIVYGRDGIQDKRLPTWWSMDGRVIDALGRMVPAPVQHLYCDNAVKALGEHVDSLYYDEHILVEHMHPVAGKGQMDDQYARVNRASQYTSDRLAFEGWLASGLASDATLLADLRG